jgi:DNA mismatch repair protein MutS2
MTREQLLESSLEQLEFERVLEEIARCTTSSLGVEHLADMLPMIDKRTIDWEISMVSEMRFFLQKGEQPPLNGIYDIRNALSLSKIGGSILNGEDLIHIATTIQSLRLVRDFFSTRIDKSPSINELTSEIHSNKLLERHITDTVDDQGLIKDNASPALYKIRRDIIDKSASLRERLNRILRKVSDEELVTDEYVTLREGRLVLPVKTEYKRRIPGIIHGESNTGSTVFLEPAEIFDMNNEIAELTFAERREIERILKTITLEIGNDATYFQIGLDKLKLVDSIYARSKFAEKYNCIAPIISEKSEIRLIDARHPILILRLSNVVPMSIELDNNKRCVVISGPNAGGKTVAMKTLGLICMMALCGMHVPAVECLVHPSFVFSDIGDKQSLENDLSTFSSHLSRIKEILLRALESDIILLDEIGTGTDPDEGSAIAAVVLNELIDRKCFSLVTTHHSSLKVFAYNNEFAINAGMEFDAAHITPTYKFNIGSPGNSYAFELIERLGLPKSLIKAARERLGEDRNNMTDIIFRMEKDAAEVSNLKSKITIERNSIEELKSKIEIQQKEFESKKKEYLLVAKAEAQSIVKNANSMIENAIREVKSGASPDSIKLIRNAIATLHKDLSIKSSEKIEPLIKFEIGDKVKMINGGSSIGEICTDPDSHEHIVVQFGSVKMRVYIGDLEKVSNKEARKTERASSGKVLNSAQAETRIDVRGMYGDEAIKIIEQSFTAALNSNISILEIIHGKGTGALRERIHNHLRNHPIIESYRLGELTEGGAGVTYVVFK